MNTKPENKETINQQLLECILLVYSALGQAVKQSIDIKDSVETIPECFQYLVFAELARYVRSLLETAEDRLKIIDSWESE